jgi:hypothetical protein
MTPDRKRPVDTALGGPAGSGGEAREDLIDRAVPPLALALAAFTSSQLRLEADESGLRALFIPAIVAMDEADRAYRHTIESTLTPQGAGALLSGMTAFRERVDEIRKRARREIGELYRHSNREYGWFDPLDAYTPSAEGLTHADGTRVATVADNARSEVDGLRGQVNAAVAKHLQPSEIETLIAAKRRRNDRFEAALTSALGSAIAPHHAADGDIGKTVRQLRQLADGWY